MAYCWCDALNNENIALFSPATIPQLKTLPSKKHYLDKEKKDGDFQKKEE